jgi:hypothetical protein
MTAKEKAHELIVKALVQFEKLTINEAKKIALIAIEEVIEALDVNCWQNSDLIIYWNEIKQEINEL